MAQTQHTPGPLRVADQRPDHPRQFQINSNFCRKGDWDDIYVSFGGYFGSYGPHLFAAAPDMLDALRKSLRAMVARSEAGSPLEMADCIALCRAAIAKAEGRTNA